MFDTLQPVPQMSLRFRAASQLTGLDAVNEATARATNALAVLHALASSPDTAADALALLHELQVHQVELELQAEELRESRADLEVALRQQIERYNLLPVACVTLDGNLVIREANLRGAQMLGVERDVACGLGIDLFFTPGSLLALQTLISRAEDCGQSSGVLEWRAPRQIERTVHAEIGPSPAEGGCIMALTSMFVGER